MRRTLVLAAAMLSVLPPAAGAQGNPARQGRGAGAAAPPMAESAPRDRAALEARVRQRFTQMLRHRLGLTDAQVQKVAEINARFAGRRRALLDQERDIRMSLREEVVAADSTRQAQVADLLDRMIRAQRQRIDVLDAEQRELAGVLTPLQRAQYLGLEEQIRRRIEGLRAQGGRLGRPGLNPNALPDGPPGGLRGRAP